RQMEQQSNALALKQLGYATAVSTIRVSDINQWLLEPARQPIVYPDVAAALAGWIASNCDQSLETLSRSLWQQVDGITPPKGASPQKLPESDSGELYRRGVID